MDKSLLPLLARLENINLELLEKHQFSCKKIEELIVNQNKLIESRRKNAEFLAQTIHSISNSLTILNLSLHTLRNNFPENDIKIFQQELDFIDQALSKLMQAIEIDSSEKKDFQKINLSKILEDYLSRKKMDLHEWELNIEKGVFIQGVLREIELLIENLIENAQKYTPEGKQIAIKLFLKDKEAVLQIKDQGCGIKEEDQKNIFKEFWRSADQKNNKKGSGLGLSIVKKIIKNHDGKIILKSTPKKGSTFIVILPA